MPIHHIAPFRPKRRGPSIAEAVKEKSWSRGFSFAWLVFEEYQVTDMVLQEKGKIERMIAPAAEPQLLWQLAKVHERKIEPQDFAREFGLLGHTHVVASEKRCGGDPIKWFRWHAKNVFEILNLLAAVDRKDVATIRSFLGAMPGLLATTEWPQNPIRAAQETVAWMLNPHIKEIRRELRLGADGIRSVFQPRALIDLVYWQLADLAEGGAMVRRCLGCSSLFIPENRLRMYCPGKTCGVSRRVRLFRERQRKGKKR